MVVGSIVGGLGLIVLSVAFIRLGASDRTERISLMVAEYGLSIAFLLAGVAIVGLAVSKLLG
ncbi:MAG TPA: hypothetical protein VJ898_12990 [Natrialbaceae archaeon]|nr:hypothetical protein [Natrialbaceae archaeon]